MSPTKRRAAGKQESRILTDPRAIRALAHPARLAVLEELSHGRELTATACAEVAGLSASAMSYHLRALERWGFVERAPASEDGRERPWRATATDWRIEDMSSQATALASDAVTGTMLDRVRTALSDWFRRESDQPKAWRDAASVSNSAVWLTADETAELAAAMRQLAEKYRQRSAAERPADARRVRVFHAVVPHDHE